MNFGVYTQIGSDHEVNEDYIITNRDKGIYIVCDGMGGHVAGDFASLEAANYLMEQLTASLDAQLDENAIVEIMVNSLEQTNRHIYRIAKDTPRLHNMGTTAIIAFINQQILYICHVGDSRAYLIKGQSVIQLTKDHSYVQRLVDEGQITDNEAKSHPRRNMILQAIGSEEMLVPSVRVMDFSDEAILLMCTDGLSDGLSDREILHITYRAKTYQEAAEQLVTRAVDNGSSDDASALLIGKYQLSDISKLEDKS